ncbi:hypothetical protein LZ30DRAFT_810307 [Colletotrichum cereale]|nr:hypothetical protein LZ30DRAFT_810307 [Colletotrichum cereale]
MADFIPSLKAQSLCWPFLWLLIQAILIGASPTPATFHTPTAETVNEFLVKRAEGVVRFPEFDKDYSGRVKKGRTLLKLLRLGNKEAQKLNNGVSIISPFQNSHKDLLRWGWTPFIRWGPKLSYFSSIDDELSNALKDPAFPVDKEEMGLYDYKQIREFEKSGTLSMATRGQYTNLVNPKAGAFLFDSNWSPSYEAAMNGIEVVPDLNALSDIAFFQWEDACQHESVNIRNLKVVFRGQVTYAPTKDIVIQALKESGHRKLPGWKDRAVFTMNDEGGAAILGSTHGSGVAWMLIQHKDKLGIKTVTEVAVWGPYGGHERFGPWGSGMHLRFTIKDV